MKRSTWIVLGSLTELVTCPLIVALAAVLVRDLRGPVFHDQGVPALIVSASAGIALGAIIASRVHPTRRWIVLLGVVSGSVLGSLALGSLFLAIEVTGGDWPQGLSAFLTGAIPGAVLGGVLGGLAGARRGDPRRPDGRVEFASQATASRPDVR